MPVTCQCVKQMREMSIADPQTIMATKARWTLAALSSEEPMQGQVGLNVADWLLLLTCGSHRAAS